MFPIALKPFIWIDYSIITLLLATMLIGTTRGFSREILVLLLWVIGFWVSLHFSKNLSLSFPNVIQPQKKRYAIIFISLLVTTILIGSFIQTWLLTRFKQSYTHTIFMERLGGLLCGIMQGVVITSILIFLAGFTPLPHKNWWLESSLLPSFQIFVIWLHDHVVT